MKKIISLFLAFSLILSIGNTGVLAMVYTDRTTYTFTENFDNGFNIESDKTVIEHEKWYYGARNSGNPANAKFSTVALDSTGIDATECEASGNVLYINGDSYNMSRNDQLPASATTENVRTEPIAVKLSDNALTESVKISFDFYACNYFYKKTDESTRRDNLTIGFVNNYSYTNATNPPVSYSTGKSSYISLQSGFVDIGKDAGWFNGVTTYNQNAWNHIDIEINNSQISYKINGSDGTVSDGGNTVLNGGFTDILLYAYYDRGGRWYVDNLNVEYDASNKLNSLRDALTLEDLGIDETGRVSEDIVLPETVEGYKIEWTSENPKVVANDGTVIRRAVSQTAVLSAKIMMNESTYVNKQFSLTVLKISKNYPNQPVNVLFEESFENGISINAGSNEMENGKWYYGTRKKENIANITYKTTTAQKENIDPGDYSSGNLLDMSAWVHTKNDQLPTSMSTGIQPRSEAVVLPISENGLTDKVKITLDLYAVNYYYKNTDETTRRDTFRIAMANNYVYADDTNDTINETTDTFIDFRNGIYNVNSNAAWNNKFGDYLQNGWNHVEIEIENSKVSISMNGTKSENTGELKNPFTHFVMYVPYDQGGRWYVDNICITYDSSEELQAAADALTLASIGVVNADEVTSLTLPETVGENNFEIEWTSENTDAISNTGTVFRRGFTQETVLNAKIKVNENTYINKQFELKVLKKESENYDLILGDYSIYGLGFDKLSDEDASAITKDLFLPQTGPDDIEITWISTNEAVIGTDGMVTRPHYTADDEYVNLTAELKICDTEGNILAEKTVVYENLLVIKEPNPYTQIAKAKEKIEAQMRENGIDTDEATGDAGVDISARITLPTDAGDDDTTVVWTTDNAAVLSAKGAVNRQEETTTVTLTATYMYNNTQQSFSYKFNVLLSELSMVNKDLAELSFGELNLSELTEDFTAVKKGSLYSSSLVWSSNNPLVSVTELTDSYKFKVTRPEFESGTDTSVELTVTATNGSQNNTRSFFANVVKLPSETELISNAVDALTFDLIKGINTDEGNITNDLSLVYNMDNDITVEWTSSNSAVINEYGEVFNPPHGSGVETVVLTASVKRSQYSTPQNAVFTLTVKPFESEDELYAKITNSLVFDILSEEEITDVTKNLILPKEWYYGSTINWSVSGGNGSITIDNESGTGVVVRPSYGSGNDVSTLFANISYNGETLVKKFAVTVLEENYLRAEEVIWSENCEGWNIGTAEFSSNSGTWMMPLTDDIPRGTITAQTDPMDGNNTLIQVGVDAKNGSGDMRMDLGTEHSGIVVACMRVYIAEKGVRPSIYVRSRGESQCDFSVKSDGSFRSAAYFTYSEATRNQDEFLSAQNVVPFGEWFDLRFEIDTNIQKYHIFINDKCITADGKIQITTDGVTTAYDSSQGIPYVYYMSQERNAPVQMLQLSMWADSTVEQEKKITYVDDLYIKKRVTYSAEQIAVGEQYEQAFLSQNNVAAITKDLVLPNIKNAAIKITGESSNLSILTNTGKVTRSDTDRTVNWTINIDDGNNVYKKTFPLTILSSKAASGLTDAEKAQADAKEIADKLKNSYLFSALEENIILPQSATYGSEITYATSNAAVITTGGIVTRGAVNQSAVLTIKTSYKGILAQESITVTVVKKNITPAGNSTIISGAGSSGGSGGGGGSARVPLVPVTNDIKTELKPVYSDVSTNHWAYSAIEFLSAKGVISGNGNGGFEPDRNVNREEFVKMIVMALNIPQDGMTDVFTDTEYDGWYNKYIAAAVENGIVNGVSDGVFGIGMKITRQDLAVMIYRAIGCSADISDKKFGDDWSIADYAKDAVYTLQKKGIINGKSDSEFAPLAEATRAEAAAMIYRIVNAGI